MSIVTIRSAPNSSTDALFRLWGSKFKTLIEIGGFWLQRTSLEETGQINWTTVARPTVTGTVMGYEMYKSIDFLSSDFPIYMKIEYRSGASAAENQPGFTVQIGTGSDGLGNLAGAQTSRTSHTPGGNQSSAIEFSSDAAGGDGYWGAYGWSDVPDGFVSTLGVNNWLISVGRSVNSHGQYTSDYITIYTSFQNSFGTLPYQFQTLKKPILGAEERPIPSQAITLVHDGVSNSAGGTYAAVFPVFPFIGYYDNPMINLIGMKNGDGMNRGTAEIPWYGITRRYLMCGITWSNGNFNNPGLIVGTAVSNFVRCGILWE